MKFFSYWLYFLFLINAGETWGRGGTYQVGLSQLLPKLRKWPFSLCLRDWTRKLNKIKPKLRFHKRKVHGLLQCWLPLFHSHLPCLIVSQQLSTICLSQANHWARFLKYRDNAKTGRQACWKVHPIWDSTGGWECNGGKCGDRALPGEGAGQAPQWPSVVCDFGFMPP